MKIVNSNGIYKIYGNDLRVMDKLPIGSYRVGFSKDSGFFLTEFSELVITDNKIYGVHEGKANKVLKAFEATNRNLGVILLGDKGMGKSLFSKLLTKKALHNNIPTIIVEEYVPGIASFLGSIDDEVMIMFDEFEKTFKKNSDGSFDPQEELLTLFDGLYSGKKLFCITCNNMYGINEYFKNRTGRVHYLFTFEYHNEEETREYLKDNLNECNYGEIDSIVRFATRAPVSYDSLRSICFEVNLFNEPFEEVIKDINLCMLDDFTYKVVISYWGKTVSFEKEINMLEEEVQLYVHLENAKGEIKIKPKDLKNVNGVWTIENPKYDSLPYNGGERQDIKIDKVQLFRRKENSFRYNL